MPESAAKPVITQPLDGEMTGHEHRLYVRIYYEDTDFSGVVYHANYLKFCERGRSDFLRVLGIDHQDLAADEDPTAFAVVHVDIRFKAPARVDDIICVRTRFAGAKGAQIFMHQTIERDGVTLCEAKFNVVCIDSNARAKRIPKDLLARMMAVIAPQLP